MLCERVGRIYREAMGYIREEDRSKSQREGGGGEEGETVAGGNVAINLGIKKSREKMFFNDLLRFKLFFQLTFKLTSISRLS